MTKQDTSRWRKPHDQIMQKDNVDKMLDLLQTLDRSLVEFSMHLYNVPRHDRVAMREQNRRLHHALREHLPRLLEASQILCQPAD